MVERPQPQSRTFRSVSRLVSTLLCSVAALVVLVGCSQDAEAPTTSGYVDIGDTGLVLELPKAWVELDPAVAREALTDEDVMAKLVSHSGTNADDTELVKNFIRTTAASPPGREPVVAASARKSANEVLPQLSVSMLRSDSLPSMDEIEEQYRDHPLRIDYLDLAEIDTPVGPAVLAAFKTKARSPDLHWAEVTVDTGPRVISVSVVTGSRVLTEQLASTIAASLQRAP